MESRAILATLLRADDVDGLSALSDRWRRAICPSDDPDLEEILWQCTRFHRDLDAVVRTPSSMDLHVQPGHAHRMSGIASLTSRGKGSLRFLFQSRIDMYKHDLGSTTSTATKQVVALVKRLNDVYRKAYDGTFYFCSTLAFQLQCDELTVWGKELSATMPVCMVQSRNSILPCYQDAWQLKDQYDKLLATIASETHGSFSPVRLKKVFRAFEKTVCALPMVGSSG